MYRKKWKNYTNNKYYESTPKSRMLKTAGLAGLAECNDLKAIEPYIWQASRLLEVGANYGRVLEYLIQNNFKGKIEAVEQSQYCFNLLKEEYGRNATIFCADLMQFFGVKYDAILWLWSGICDFAASEQGAAIGHLATLLSPQGVLIIETPCHERKVANPGSVGDEQEGHLIENGVELYGHFPTPEKTIQMGESAHLVLLKFIEYLTSTEVPRRLFVFQKR